jgi:hypothetical protein
MVSPSPSRLPSPFPPSLACRPLLTATSLLPSRPPVPVNALHSAPARSLPAVPGRTAETGSGTLDSAVFVSSVAFTCCPAPETALTACCEAAMSIGKKPDCACSRRSSTRSSSRRSARAAADDTLRSVARLRWMAAALSLLGLQTAGGTEAGDAVTADVAGTAASAERDSCCSVCISCSSLLLRALGVAQGAVEGGVPSAMTATVTGTVCANCWRPSAVGLGIVVEGGPGRRGREGMGGGDGHGEEEKGEGEADRGDRGGRGGVLTGDAKAAASPPGDAARGERAEAGMGGGRDWRGLELAADAY